MITRVKLQSLSVLVAEIFGWLTEIDEEDVMSYIKNELYTGNNSNLHFTQYTEQQPLTNAQNNSIIYFSKCLGSAVINCLVKYVLSVRTTYIPFLIEPNFQQGNPINNKNKASSLFRAPIFDYIDRFIKNAIEKTGSQKHLFVLGGAGAGKSTLISMLKERHSQYPMMRNLECISIKCGFDTISKIRNVKKRNRTVLLLDALDESFRYVTDRMEDQTALILKETKNFLSVIVTCRTQFFPKFNAHGFQLQDQIQIKDATCSIVHLSPFSDEQVAIYLNIRLRTKEKTKKAEYILRNMYDLKYYPMLLNSIDSLISDPSLSDNPYLIYNKLINIWLDREVDAKKYLLCTKYTLLKACQHLARVMTQDNLCEISDKNLMLLIADQEEFRFLKIITIGGKSLLSRNSNGNLQFSHKSIQEFLLVQSLQDNQGCNFPNISEMTSTFMRACSWKNINLTYANLQGVNLNKINFIGAKLEGVNFTGSNLKGANFLGANLNGANLTKTNLEGANFARAYLDEVDLTEAKLSGANFSRANLARANFSKTDLEGTSFSRANLEGTNFTRANLEKTDFSRTNQDRANFIGANLDGANPKSFNWQPTERQLNKLDQALDVS